MKKIIGLILLLVVSCDNFDYRVDPDVNPYLQKFYSYAKANGVKIDKENLIVKFRDGIMEERGSVAYAVCQVLNRRQRYIYIDVDYWNSSDDEVRELIVLHECGHIFLCRSHQSYPNSIMKAELNREGWSISKQEMIIELFRKSECRF